MTQPQKIVEPNFSRHTIADVRDWQKLGRLEIQPDFQRRAVWPDAAKIMLIDSILKKYPLPKIFVGTSIVDGSTKRIIIDGQQRITAILEFLANKFSLQTPYSGEYAGAFFKDLPVEAQTNFLSYNLDFNEFQNWSDEEVREVYNRVNKYSFSLTKQELRRADFPGDFLKLSEDLSVLEFFEDAKIFTPANRRRLADVEYTSELVSVLLHGPRDKKEDLDQDYLDHQAWPEAASFKERFGRVLKDIALIFSKEEFPIAKTRFRQKSDFYSLFAAIDEIHQRGQGIVQARLPDLREELRGLDGLIEPSAPGLYGEYAIRCVSDANSLSSRRWRTDFLKAFLMAVYNPTTAEQDEIADFLFRFIGIFDDGMRPPAESSCVICDEEVTEHSGSGAWALRRDRLFLSQASLVHKPCVEESNEYVFKAES